MVNPFRRIMAGLRGLFRKTDIDRELDEELGEFLETAVEHRMRTGMTREQAVRSARIETGSVEAVKDRVRDVGWESVVESFLQDLRYAARLLRASPGFTAVAVLTLALGIGANTAIFTLVDAVLLTTLPVENPAELVVLDVFTARGEKQNLSYPLFERIRDEVDAFSGVFAAQDGFARLDVGGPGAGSRSEEARVQLVSGEFFPVLGVRALMGRTLIPEDNKPAGDSGVAVLSYPFWQRRFGGDAAVIGSSLIIKRQNVTIVGVAPAGFFGESVGRAPDVWVPLVMQPRFDRGRSLLDRPNVGWLRVVGRLRPGATGSTADAALAVALTSLRSESTDFSKVRSTGWRAIVRWQPRSAGFPRAVLAAPAHSRGDRRDGSPHRLRQRGEPPAGTGGRASAGDGRPPGDRCWTPPAGASALHREPGAGGSRWSARPAPRMVGQSYPARARLDRLRANPDRRGAQRARPWVHVGALGRDRHDLWPGAGVDDLESRRRNRTETQHRHADAGGAVEDAAGHAGRAVTGAPDRRRLVRADAAQSQGARPGICRRDTAGSPRRAGSQRLQDGPAPRSRAGFSTGWRRRPASSRRPSRMRDLAAGSRGRVAWRLPDTLTNPKRIARSGRPAWRRGISGPWLFGCYAGGISRRRTAGSIRTRYPSPS